VLPFLAFLYAGHLLQPMGGASEKVRIEIPVGANAGQISKILQEKGLIRSPMAFQFMARLLGEARNMKAGAYEIPRDRGVIQIIEHLVSGDAISVWVVIPEGTTIDDVADRLDRARLGSKDNFLRRAGRAPRRYGKPFPAPWGTLEGYLMPDTYRFDTNAAPGEILEVMLDNWEKKVYEPRQELFRQSRYGTAKTVIIASMIEKEARVQDDRPLIASVIHNRLRRRMPLQIDATVIYALGRHRARVTFDDLKVKSPYNTYRVKSLPPGPICSPGEASIDAALKPARTNFLFYVARADGRHIFTRTAEEHNAAVRQVREGR